MTCSWVFWSALAAESPTLPTVQSYGYQSQWSCVFGLKCSQDTLCSLCATLPNRLSSCGLHPISHLEIVHKMCFVINLFPWVIACDQTSWYQIFLSSLSSILFTFPSFGHLPRGPLLLGLTDLLFLPLSFLNRPDILLSRKHRVSTPHSILSHLLRIEYFVECMCLRIELRPQGAKPALLFFHD